jgi:phosphate transport system substrate-binding protein
VQIKNESQKILREDNIVERILDPNYPYDYIGTENIPVEEQIKYAKLSEPPKTVIGSNYPKLGGVEVAYPFYAAMARELYKGLNKDSLNEHVSYSTGASAYSSLTAGYADILFGMHPTPEQMEYAKAEDKELVLTPVAKEALVFYVNSSNPVNSLATAQIQDIYQGKTANWSTFEGRNEKILPFQQQDNSQSQIIMKKTVMKRKFLPSPLVETIDRPPAGWPIRVVAQYRNYSSAIGYTFRNFITELNSNAYIKMIEVDGAEPAAENIKNGTYPYTEIIYAVTAGQPDGNSKVLIDWILSEQGQAFVEKCGYVGI